MQRLGKYLGQARAKYLHEISTGCRISSHAASSSEGSRCSHSRLFIEKIFKNGLLLKSVVSPKPGGGTLSTRARGPRFTGARLTLTVSGSCTPATPVPAGCCTGILWHCGSLARLISKRSCAIRIIVSMIDSRDADIQDQQSDIGR